MRLAAKIAAALILLVLVLIALEFATGNFGRPLLYRMPAGYRGWVLVEYNNSGCPPLSSDWLYLVIDISASGLGCTSSGVTYGWRYTRFEYINEHGVQCVLRSSGWDPNPEVWGIDTSQDKWESLFVGSKQDLDRSWASKPRR
jgi:hypothetical protein